MLIFTDHITPRLQYITRFIFDEFLGIQTTITTDLIDFESCTGPKISYTNQRIADEFHLHASGLINVSGIQELDVGGTRLKDIPVLFSHDHDSDLSFDIFAAVFYMISRYEEYLPSDKDKYDRFSAENSISYKNGFLHKAVADHWILLLYNALKEKYTKIEKSSRSFSFIPTIDIDNAFAIRAKGPVRITGGLLKSFVLLRFGEVVDRIRVLSGKIQDPFQTYPLIRSLHRDLDYQVITFILTAGYGKYDTGLNPKRSVFRDLVNDFSAIGKIGLHPSWKSNQDVGLLTAEYQLLSEISGTSLTKSRQHYLKMQLPETYNRLEEIGIIEEHSMGYPSHPGFRAGTATPYMFYDLTKEEETNIKIVPFQVMDRTLKDYLGLSPGEAVEKIKKLVDEVRSVNGTFVSIWHNEAFSDYGEWKGWLEVYEKLLEFMKY